MEEFKFVQDGQIQEARPHLFLQHRPHAADCVEARTAGSPGSALGIVMFWGFAENGRFYGYGSINQDDHARGAKPLLFNPQQLQPFSTPTTGIRL